MSDPFKQPLHNVRVVDFSWVMAGPMTTKMLGAMGAEIIKVESSTRPEFSERDGMFEVINNNKRSCTVNITTEEGQRLLRDLVAHSDVVVENFSSRVLQKYGLSYQHLRQIKPDLIFVSASGLGRQGSQRDYLAYGSLLQGYSGRVSMIGTPNPHLEAMGILPAWTDPITAIWETLSVLTALHHRTQTGEGSFVDLSMLESTVSLLPVALINAALQLPDDPGHNPMLANAAPSGCFRCAGDDNWLALSVTTDEQWRGLCTAFDLKDLADSYNNADARLAARDALNDRVGKILRNWPAVEVMERLTKRGVPASCSRSIADLVADAHLKSRGVFEDDVNGLHMGTLPWRQSDGWRGRYAPTPAIGADNDYVFGDLLGLSNEKRDELKASGVLA